MIERRDLGFCELINFVVLKKEESELVRRWRNDPEIRHWMYTDHEIGEDEHYCFVGSLEGQSCEQHFLVKRHDEPIGVVNIGCISEKHRSAKLGIYSAPDARGAGETLINALFFLAFKEFGLHTLKLEVIEGNDKAVEFYEKHGFRHEGKLREYIHKNGEWLDVLLMGITEQEAEGRG
ncbi:UDP-4-amino-4,6-dideoxy-N-acetyl-beta-L-altrosamine N-acetyltransferase [Limisalsivibrio acetivorans]|uniref:UDP-4-amino-4, 6-dideoxy-N-acetyl-beta-L-altrosamine N-acetyltransferase n=1 Tax=Limisalsivibrio acetivorans TaxID=1304888 RepID=UPI0004242B9E|nr:UDP-4-amino-4,6-dideoxy-N-acetyl-beta-L-altrosamine N-acetyltransferase [Limisalsivibrio acetivorans]